MVFKNYKVKDYAQTTLSGSISDSATSMTVATGDGALFPSTGDFFITLEAVTLNEHETETITKREQVKCTTRSSDSFTIVRAQNGTTAQAFSDGDRVSLYFVAENLDDINTEVARLEDDKLDNDELRTGLGASKLLTTNGDGEETELAFSGNATDALLGNGTWGATPVDINGQILENGALASGDVMVFYDLSAAALRKRNMKATTSREGMVEKATNTETVNGTADKYPDANEIKNNYTLKSNVVISDIDFIDSSQANINIAHGLGKVPRSVISKCYRNFIEGGIASFDGTTVTQKVYDSESALYVDGLFAFGSSGDTGKWTITTIDETNITLSYSFVGSFSSKLNIPFEILFLG